ARGGVEQDRAEGGPGAEPSRGGRIRARHVDGEPAAGRTDRQAGAGAALEARGTRWAPVRRTRAGAASPSRRSTSMSTALLTMSSRSGLTEVRGGTVKPASSVS